MLRVTTVIGHDVKLIFNRCSGVRYLGGIREASEGTGRRAANRSTAESTKLKHAVVMSGPLVQSTKWHEVVALDFWSDLLSHSDNFDAITTCLVALLQHFSRAILHTVCGPTGREQTNTHIPSIGTFGERLVRFGVYQSLLPVGQASDHCMSRHVSTGLMFGTGLSDELEASSFERSN